MKAKLIVGLFAVAMVGCAAANALAQEVVGATEAPAPANVMVPQTSGPCPECDECVPVGVGIGDGLGIGGRLGGMRGAGLSDRLANSRSQRAEKIGRERSIVEPSPFANPSGSLQDWNRFRYYPYGYYPQNFGPGNMSVPKYNPAWQNYYPAARRYHEGKHFLLDVF